MNDKPRVLFLDTENSPNKAFYYGSKWEPKIVKVTEPWYLLCFGYKWLGKGKTVARALPDFKSEKDMLIELRNLLDETDVLVGHNIDKFDARQINTRLAYFKILPPSPFKTVDTLKLARHHFNFFGNSLKDLLQFFGLPAKIHNEEDLALKCMAGDKSAWKKMVKYQKRDVDSLEPLYKIFLPWVQNHPSHPKFVPKIICKSCKSTRMYSRGTDFSGGFLKRRFICNDCGKSIRVPITV